MAITNASGKKSDLYLLPDFPRVKEYEERIRNLDLFSKVELVDSMRFESYRTKNNKILYGIGFFLNYFRVNNIVRSIVGGSQYKTIYISTHHNIGKFVCIYFLKRGAEIVYFDDGEGSYDNPLVYEAFGIERIVRSLLFGKRTVLLSKNRQLYSPDLFKSFFGDGYNVSPIENWAKDEILLDKINLVCGYSDNAKINQKCVFLGTMPTEEYDKEGQVIYEKLVNTCAVQLGTDFVLKKHPRDKSETAYSCNEYYNYADIPFEVICANSDIENKVLISSGSTSVLTPKLLFDMEPTVILLNRIAAEPVDMVKRDRIISYVRNMYRDKNKFYVPESMDELCNILALIAASYDYS